MLFNWGLNLMSFNVLRQPVFLRFNRIKQILCLNFTFSPQCKQGSNPPIVPPRSCLGGTGPMSRNTTNRTDYKDWGPIYPERFYGPPYKEPEGDRYFDSTYKNDFSEVSIIRLA